MPTGLRAPVVSDEADLVANLRAQLEALNRVSFTDGEWKRLFRGWIAADNDGIAEKTRRIQRDHVHALLMDDGTVRNISLIDKRNVHNNRLQVMNQYTQQGAYENRYDVSSILVNGLPLVHVELKRRGVAIQEAFNQIERYQRDSSVGLRPVRVRADLRHIQRDPHQVLLQHHALFRDPRARWENHAREENVQQLQVHQLVGGCRQHAHFRFGSLHRYLLSPSTRC